MELYNFPKRGELRTKLKQVWPAREYDGLIERVARLAEKPVTTDGLVAALSLAIEDFVADTERNAEFRAAAYANLPAAIRVLLIDTQMRNLAINEYVSMYQRLLQIEASQ